MRSFVSVMFIATQTGGLSVDSAAVIKTWHGDILINATEESGIYEFDINSSIDLSQDGAAEVLIVSGSDRDFDFNEDGRLNFIDAWDLSFAVSLPQELVARFDFNGNGSFDSQDLDRFIALIYSLEDGAGVVADLDGNGVATCGDMDVLVYGHLSSWHASHLNNSGFTITVNDMDYISSADHNLDGILDEDDWEYLMDVFAGMSC